MSRVKHSIRVKKYILLRYDRQYEHVCQFQFSKEIFKV
jgi:hypothetical protein